MDLFINTTDTLRMYLTATTGAKEAAGDRPRFRRTKAVIIKVDRSGLATLSLVRAKAETIGDIHIAGIQLSKISF